MIHGQRGQSKENEGREIYDYMTTLTYERVIYFLVLRSSFHHPRVRKHVRDAR